MNRVSTKVCWPSGIVHRIFVRQEQRSPSNDSRALVRPGRPVLPDPHGALLSPGRARPSMSFMTASRGS